MAGRFCRLSEMAVSNQHTLSSGLEVVSSGVSQLTTIVPVIQDIWITVASISG